MTTFKNAVTLRGFLARDAEIHASEPITEDAYAVLHLAIMRGTWNIATNAWIPRTDWHRVICPGPFFCGFTRDMRRGDYIEIEAELREIEEVQIVAVDGQNYPIKRMTSAIYGSRVQRLERPLVVVDTSEDG